MLGNISEKLVKIDHHCDLVPFVSTATNIAILFFKCIKPVIDLFSKKFPALTLFSTNVYFHYLSNKSTLRSLWLLTPLFGNAIVYLLRDVKKEDGERFNNLGMCYSNGRNGFKQDDAKAFHYFRKSTELNDKSGIHNLGWAYLYGRGQPKCLDTAEELLKRAADLGNIDSTDMLVDVYLEKKDPVNAIRFFEKEGDLGVGRQFNRLGMCFSQGVNECKQDDQQAFICFEKAADLQDKSGIHNLGWAYLNGRGVEKNLDQAEKYLLQSAGLGNVKSMCLLGDVYAEKQDTANAIKFYEQAGELGNGTAYNSLALCYSNGINGFKQDDQQAFTYYKQAADLNSKSGKHHMGWAYLFGRGVEKDLDQAEKYLMQLSTSDVPESMYLLGVLFEAKNDPKEANNWYVKAASLGSEDARKHLPIEEKL